LDVSLAGGGVTPQPVVGPSLNAQSNAINGVIPPSTNTTQPGGLPYVPNTSNNTSNSSNIIAPANNASLPTDPPPVRGGSTAISKSTTRGPTSYTRLVSSPVYVFFSNRGDVPI
jgi:hypothetical protein